MAALEAEVAQLKVAVSGVVAQAALPARVDRAEVDIARVALEAGSVEQLRADIAALKEVVLQPRFRLLDSLIVPDFPRLFKEFRAKRWALLWRGSRDSFGAEEFHRRCDGRADTLTLIVDTDGNMFGGFTSVEWESRVWNRKYGKENNGWKGDDSGRSFLFTLRNPHGVPPRKFPLKAERKQDAIYCDSERGPRFGNCIYVSDNCNANRNSHTRIGNDWGDRVYANDTAFKDFFTGAFNFTVKEIEVFEIAD
jgi:hypothetical protein